MFLAILQHKVNAYFLLLFFLYLLEVVGDVFCRTSPTISLRKSYIDFEILNFCRWYKILRYVQIKGLRATLTGKFFVFTIVKSTAQFKLSVGTWMSQKTPRDITFSFFFMRGNFVASQSHWVFLQEEKIKKWKEVIPW